MPGAYQGAMLDRKAQRAGADSADRSTRGLNHGAVRMNVVAGVADLSNKLALRR